MDNRIRKNEKCIIGLPACDFVYSSTRTCFIAYGFRTSTMEMDILRNILKDRGVQVEEAGGSLTPGEYAFCGKICSKIITSQFAIAILNYDEMNNQLTPNANVNMEYGLMLGFNKFVVPFQKEEHPLPFNISGLDTIKYNQSNFMSKAEQAIDLAIEKTEQNEEKSTSIPPSAIEQFLLSNEILIAQIDNPGDKAFLDMGIPLGFILAHDFSGMEYRYFGNFTNLRRDTVISRITTLIKILEARKNSMYDRLKSGLISKELAAFSLDLFHKFQIWVLVTMREDAEFIQQHFIDNPLPISVEVFSINND